MFQGTDATVLSLDILFNVLNLFESTPSFSQLLVNISSYREAF